MRAAEVLEDKFKTWCALQPSTIYRLSAKNMPASVIEQVLARLTEQPALSDIDVNELIDQCLLVEKPSPAAPFGNRPPHL